MDTQYCRFILPGWAKDENPDLPAAFEGEYSYDEIAEINASGYNVYYWPNHPDRYPTDHPVSGRDVDVFNCCFIDCDLKAGVYPNKDAFLETLLSLSENFPPSRVIDSGNGIHAYWNVSDLSAQSYLRLQRRLCRYFNTDEAVGTLAQLMRLPETINTKKKFAFVPCIGLASNDSAYTCEDLDKHLPVISAADEKYCADHYNRVHNPDATNVAVSEELPQKFGKLLRENDEVRDLFAGNTSDRSKNDYRLGHVMYAHGFTKNEAASVLVNSAKALQRSPSHRVKYATDIVEKIWTYEQSSDKVQSPTVRDILSRGEETVKGTRFPCNKLIDDTHHGFRLSQMLGIAGGSGIGKTSLTLNCFLWFAANNPDYHHFFFALEQPAGEIADRVRKICQGNDTLYDKIHIVSNYNEDGTYNNFSVPSVDKHISDFEEQSGNKVGAVVIDHLGVLDKNTKHGEGEGLMGVIKALKSMAVNRKIFLMPLSQVPREKVGIGDIELNKDAPYGTVFIESFCDYLITTWQPLKRAYTQGAPTVMAFKFVKIRHKNQIKDTIKEDVCYQLFFDPDSERLREMTQDEEKSAKYYLNIATNMRKTDRKTDLVPYQSRKINEPALEDTKQRDGY